ncbi:hypothetical protein BJX76DRAFT_326650 [Aspergillus varians]
MQHGRHVWPSPLSALQACSWMPFSAFSFCCPLHLINIRSPWLEGFVPSHRVPSLIGIHCKYRGMKLIKSETKRFSMISYYYSI